VRSAPFAVRKAGDENARMIRSIIASEPPTHSMMNG
jgi:hypothetical protein